MKKHLPLMLSALLLLPVQAGAQNAVPLNQGQAPVQVPQAVPPVPQKSTCETVKDFKTEIHVNVMLPQARYDLSSKRDVLKTTGGKQLATWAAKNKTEVLWQADDSAAGGAFGIGAWAVSSDIKTDSRPVDTYGAFYCPYIKSASIDILSPVMVLAPAEAPVGSCAYDVITKHFQRHIQSATDYLNGAAPQIQAGLGAMLDQATKGAYVAKPSLLHAQREMKENVQGAVAVYYRDAIRKQLAVQMEAIDTAESKAGLAAQIAACPAGVPAKAGVFNLLGR